MHNKKGSQIDIAAFLTRYLADDGLLSKPMHYGIYGKIWLWIYNFLKCRIQSVIVDGKQSRLIVMWFLVQHKAHY